MILNKNLIAIGRSRYLYDTINHLKIKGYSFKAIITEEAYEEYDIKHNDFENLAISIGARFFMTKSLFVEEIIQLIKDNNVTIAISANWKHTIPKRFLDLFHLGILNFHLGNLPDYKGNATVNWTILNGEKHIYSNIHKMDPALDAGDVVARKEIPISADTYISEILEQATKDAPLLYEEALETVCRNPKAYKVKGTESGLRCFPRLPEDSQINWQQSVNAIYRLIRASSHPYQGAFSFFNGQKIIIWKASPYQSQTPFLSIPGHVVYVDKCTHNIIVACNDGLLEIQEIEVDGKRVTPATIIKSIRVRFKFKSDV